MKPSKVLIWFFNKYKDKAGVKHFDQQKFLEAIEDVEKLEKNSENG
jgi:hypothetical protein